MDNNEDITIPVETYCYTGYWGLQEYDTEPNIVSGYTFDIEIDFFVAHMGSEEIKYDSYEAIELLSLIYIGFVVITAIYNLFKHLL